MQKLAWGILGTGNIASQFAAGVSASDSGTLAAVASRSLDSAAAFANRFDVAAAHGSYDALLADERISAVYVSLPNALHHEWTLKALAAGKHVLCEKPIALDEAQAAEMFAAAKRANRVLIEAFMYRAHPQTIEATRRIAQGDIGSLRSIRLSFSFRVRNPQNNIRYDPALGGGCLMDVGCYCINFARLLAGRAPLATQAIASMHATGVDESISGLLDFGTGLSASFNCGMNVQADNTAHLCGDEGYMTLAWPWKPQPPSSTILLASAIPPRQDNPTGKPPTAAPAREIVVDNHKPLYALEADAFCAAVTGATPFMPIRETMDNMRTMDALRRQIGLVF